jgi:hypothetical protein
MSLGLGSLELGSTLLTLAALFVAAVVASAAWPLLRRIVAGPRDAERRRALAILLFLAGSGLLALAVGYGRSAPPALMPGRYAILSVPALVAAWFAWERYGDRRPRLLVQGAVLGATSSSAAATRPSCCTGTRTCAPRGWTSCTTSASARSAGSGSRRPPGATAWPRPPASADLSAEAARGREG